MIDAARGLQLRDDISFFGTVAPMMLGFYERPLQEALEAMTRTGNHDHLIVDVGSASAPLAGLREWRIARSKIG